MLTVNFILPFKPRRPAGGFRIMYEYANRLAKKGYRVHLTFPIATPYMNYRFPYIIRKWLTKIEGFHTYKWFDFHESITMSYVPRVEDKYIINADVIVTTWWATVLEAGKLSPSKGKKINLIQGFENWEGHEDLLYKSYDLPHVTNVVVSSYLQNIVQKYTSKSIRLIHNAISSDVFYLENKIEDRNPFSIIMNYSIQEIKGSQYGLEALIKLKEKYPLLGVDFFGVCPKPHDLPSWITYYRNPSNLRSLYNKNAIIISNSLIEGFGLVSAEGAFCGCALVCTAIDGHKEYAFHNETALLVEPKNVDEMVEAVSRLLDDNEFRIALATRGNQYVQRYEWSSSETKFESLVNELVNQ